jgi:hypothetical protein
LLDEPIGALNIYSRTAAAFTPENQTLAGLFADETSVVLTEARVDMTDEQTSMQFGDALRSRQLIALAQGVIMELDGVSESDAYTVLRRFSIKSGGSLQERAQDVINSTRAEGLDLGLGQDGLS